MTLEYYTDPLPQALVLTAIVIGFGMTAFAITLAVKGFVVLGTDQIDGKEGSAVSDGSAKEPASDDGKGDDDKDDKEEVS